MAKVKLLPLLPPPPLRGLHHACMCCTMEQVAVPLATLPSRHETFFIGAPSPDGWLAAGEKAGAVLGWHPQDRLEVYYTRSTHTSRL